MASVLSRSRSYPVEMERAFDVLLTAPLPRVFAHRSGPIPRVGSVEQAGLWGERGQERVIRLADGSTMRETLTAVDRPYAFEYRLDTFTGRMRHVAKAVHGRWAFDAVGTGVRVTWTWRLEAAHLAARGAIPAFGRFWQGYARNALDEIESLLLDA